MKTSVSIEQRSELNPLSPVTSSHESVQVNVSSGIDQSSSSQSSSAIVNFVGGNRSGPFISARCIPMPHLALNPYHNYGYYAGGRPFQLCFIRGNISICHGCKQHYVKDAGPPFDLCISHEEWRTFRLPSCAEPQSRFGNVYYHANVPCIKAVWPHFNPATLLIPPDLKVQPVHDELLQHHFGINR